MCCSCFDQFCRNLIITEDLYTFNFSREISTSTELAPCTNGLASVLPPIQNILRESTSRLPISFFRKLFWNHGGYPTLDYRSLRSCNPERGTRASSSSQGQQVMLQTTYTEVPHHGRRTWQPHSTQETMGTRTLGATTLHWSIYETLQTTSNYLVQSSISLPRN